MKKLAITLLVLLSLREVSQAQMVGVGVGFRQTTINSDSSAVTISNLLGLQAGALYYGPITSSLEMRIGGFISQRNFTSKVNGFDATANDYKLTYLDIPATIGFRPNESFTIFAGPLLALNVAKEASLTGTDLSTIKGTSVGLTGGFTAKIAGTYGIEVFVEQSGSLADHTKDPTSVGINLLMLWE